jgi:uncharacterized protein
MTIHYFDPSAWVKRHFQEAGSEEVIALFRAQVAAACCRLGVVEMIATVARKSSEVPIAGPALDAILDNIRADFAAFRVVPVDEPLIVAATELALRHRLRTMDALHLASALSLRTAGEVVMVSADAELLAAAAKERLGTISPAVPIG